MTDALLIQRNESKTKTKTQISKKINLLPNTPEFNNYVKNMDNDSKSFWSSPSPILNFNRYRLGRDMLPPFSQTPPDKLSNMLSELKCGGSEVNTTIKSVNIDTDYNNSIRISLEGDEMMFVLEE